MNFNNSKKMLNSALDIIPNGTQTMSKCHNQWKQDSVPYFVEKADGPFFWDVDGNRFIDTYAALGPILLGYNNQVVNQSMIAQIQKGTIFSLSSSLEVQLAQKLVEIIPCCESVRFGKNGSDVTSIAVRVARAYTGKDHILSPSGHYHGWCDFYAASSALNKGLPICTRDLVENFEYNDLEGLEQKLQSQKFAAVIMEPCRYEAPKEGFLQGAKDLCKKYGAVLIFDEIVTSFRWALGGAQEYYGVTPDLATIGKAMSNGMPISALVGKKEIMQELDYGKVFFSGTYLGETVSIAASLATIEFMEGSPDVYDHIWGAGKMCADAFNRKCKDIGLNASMNGIGPIYNIQFDSDEYRKEYSGYMAEYGVFSGVALYLTYAHKQEHINSIIEASEKSLERVKKYIESGHKNKDSNKMFKDLLKRK